MSGPLTLKAFRAAAMGALFLKLVGGVAGFAVNVVLARLLGAEGTGVYYLAASLVTFSAMIAKFGLDPVVLRTASAHWSSAERDKIRALVRSALIFPLLLSAVAVAGVSAAAGWLSLELFNEPALKIPLRIMVWAIFPYGAAVLFGEVLKAIGMYRAGIIVQNVIIPFVMTALVLVLVPAYGIAGATAGFVGASGVAFLAGFLGVRSQTASGEFVPVRELLRRLGGLLKPAVPLFIVTGITAVSNALGTTLIGIWHDSGEVGGFGVAFRLAMLSTLVVTGINSVVAPAMAAAYTEGRTSRLGRLGRQSVSVSLLLGVPMMLPLALFPQFFMGIFGQEFVPDWPVLAVLAVGQIAYLSSGASGYLLVMTNNERAERDVAVLTLLLLIVLSVGLIPPLGGVGAALATAASAAFRAAATVAAVRRRLQIRLWRSGGGE